jgi:antitoxin component of RelBE/YafQ-DinJ toxin-antitoxin module
MPIKEPIKKGIVKKVSLLLLEDGKNNTGVLETKDAIIEYDILVWSDKYGTVLEKKGKTTKEKLDQTLVFDALLGYDYDVTLDLTVIINGKRYPFLPNSPFNDVVSMIEDRTGKEFQYSTSISIQEPEERNLTMEEYQTTQEFLNFIDNYRDNADYPEQSSPEDLAIIEQAENDAIEQAYQQYRLSERQVELATAEAEYEAGGYIDVPFYVVAQSVIDRFIARSFNNGKLPIVLNDVVDNVNYLETQVKALQKQIELKKKQSLGALFATKEETNILTYFRDEDLYNELLNLVKAYQKTGLANLSPYRVGVYESLKAATDNLIVLKGKLENINFVPKRREAAAAAPKTDNA